MDERGRSGSGTTARLTRNGSVSQVAPLPAVQTLNAAGHTRTQSFDSRFFSPRKLLQSNSNSNPSTAAPNSPGIHPHSAPHAALATTAGLTAISNSNSNNNNNNNSNSGDEVVAHPSQPTALDLRYSTPNRVYSSMLSPDLGDVLKGHPSMSFFLRFLERRGGRGLNSVRFCLQVQSFRHGVAMSRRGSDTHLEAVEASVPASDLPAPASNPTTRSNSNLKQTDIDLELAIHIYDTYVSMQATSPLRLHDSVRQQIEDNISREEGLLPDAFDVAYEKLFEKLRHSYWPKFRHATEYAQYLQSVIQDGNFSLLDVMLSDDTLPCFREYLERNNTKAAALLQFWLIVDTWVHNLVQTSDIVSVESAAIRNQEDAMAIYDKYVSMQAPFQVGAGDKARIEVENNICAEAGPKWDSFLKLQAAVFLKLEQKHFPMFLSSSTWQRFTGELVEAASRRAPDETTDNNSSEESGTEDNMEPSPAPTPAAARSETPKASNAKKLHLGHLNEWGVYMRDEEVEKELQALNPPAEPIAYTPYALTGLFKPVDKKEQELKALEIAQSIIAEVTRETRPAHGAVPLLPSSNCKSAPPPSTVVDAFDDEDAI